MLRLALCTLVLAKGSLAQTAHLSAAASRAVTEAVSSDARSFAAPPAAAPGDPVLSVHGVCREANQAARGAGDCTVTVSREQFDNLMSVLSANRQVTPDMKDHFAKTYAEVLAFEGAARELGIDHSPQYQATMRWLQAKTLADLLRRRLKKESGKVSEAETASYYREKLSQFEEVRLRRLVLSKNDFAGGDRQKAEQDAQRVAAELRKRASRGERIRFFRPA